MEFTASAAQDFSVLFREKMSVVLLIFTVLVAGSSSSVTEASRNISVEPGQNVTLTCEALENQTVVVVKWTRADLRPSYIYILRDDHEEMTGQHPYFKNRVDLLDRQMKDGDVSLVLKNVTTDDGGTYECRVVHEGTNRDETKVLGPDTISTIYLQVAPPPSGNEEGGSKEGRNKEVGNEEESSRGRVGLIVTAVLCIIIILIVIYFKKKNPLPDEEAGDVN